MNYGLYISASGASAAMYRQNVHASNLSNIDTAGFKALMPLTRQRDPARVEDNLYNLSSNDLLEQLGAGAQSAPSRIAFTQGPLQMTGQPLDLAIRGDGFFVVRTDSVDGASEIALSRDGRLTRGPESTLVRAADGLPVLDTSGRPIDLPDNATIRVDPDGTVTANGDRIATLDLVDVADRASLTPAEGGLFKPRDADTDNLEPATGLIAAGAIEGSSVNEFSALMQMTSAARAAQGNIGMIQYHDRIMNGAVNRLGRTV